MSLLEIDDDALSPPLFRKLWKQVRAVGTERLRKSYWTTFWFDFGPPQNVVDVAVLALREKYEIDSRGVEWWLGRTDLRRVPIELHADRDNHLFDQTGKLAHPTTSSVLYFNQVKGGALLVFDQKPSRDGKRLIPRSPKQWALASPKPNRFVRFSGNRVHAVLDANNELPSRPLRIPPMPLRWALVVNWWNRRPRDVPNWDRHIYAPLALPMR